MQSMHALCNHSPTGAPAPSQLQNICMDGRQVLSRWLELAQCSQKGGDAESRRAGRHALFLVLFAQVCHCMGSHGVHMESNRGRHEVTGRCKGDPHVSGAIRICEDVHRRKKLEAHSMKARSPAGLNPERVCASLEGQKRF